MRLFEWKDSGLEVLSVTEKVGLAAMLVPALLLLIVGLVWRAAATGDHPAGKRSSYRHAIWWLTLLQFTITVGFLVSFTFGVTNSWSGKLVGSEWTLAEFSIDGISLLMMSMVSGVGWAVVGFSERYLNGDRRLNRFFGLLAMAVGSVSLMSISGNMLQFLIFWFAASIGMHFLLQHFRDRPRASYGAWSKFWVSRIGDLFLLLALQGFGEFAGSWNFESLTTQAENDPTNPLLTTASIVLVIGCIIKSVQFPFHFWLSETLEAPTPVSAFMHAGIVNAGGFLIIRMSPILIQSSFALDILFAVGLVTVLFGSLVMLTQPSIKSQLVYSTIAQMGFMMLQCGVGGFVAAMLHLVGHSIYKSHAFLSSGMVISERLALKSTPCDSKPSYVWFAGSGFIFLSLFAGTLWFLNLGPAHKPGSLVLASVFAAAIVVWLFAGVRQSAYVRWRAVGTAIVLMFLYCGSYLLVAKIVSGSVAAYWQASQTLWRPAIALSVIACVAVVSGFALTGTNAGWLKVLRIHASRGFYIESWIRRHWQLLSHEI